VELGHPEARGHRELRGVLTLELARFDLFAKPLGEYRSPLRGVLRQDHHELLAAVAGRDVGIAHRPLE
jgi:hypothetical protein